MNSIITKKHVILSILQNLLADIPKQAYLEIIRNLGKCNPGPRWHLVNRTLPNHLVYFILDGKGKLNVGKEQLELSANMLVMVTAGTTSSIKSAKEDPLQFYPIHFIRAENASGSAKDIPKVVIPISPFMTHALVKDLEEILQLLRSGSDKINSGAADSLFFILMVRIMQELQLSAKSRVTGHNAVLENIKRQIDQDPVRRFTIGELAEEAGMCRSLFVREFKKFSGFAPSQYMILNRCSFARALIEQEGYRVNEAADACGYPDAFTFSRQFKKVFEMSPSAAIQK